MKPEAQRIAIAEACGWRHHPVEAVGAQAQIFDGLVWFRHAESNTIACPRDLPDYLSDLNAMHEAEKVLTEDQWGPYCVTLNKIACRIQCENTHTCGYTIAATAAQRAEAFLRTIWKWEDAQ